jgi:CheY-like chemotaxis protein
MVRQVHEETPAKDYSEKNIGIHVSYADTLSDVLSAGLKRAQREPGHSELLPADTTSGEAPGSSGTGYVTAGRFNTLNRYCSIESGGTMAKISVLLVEDDDLLAKIAETRLKNLGYDLAGRATTAAEAMAIVVNNRPDIVLMDITIKGNVDGIDAANMIKNGFKLPVVFLTSHSDDALLTRAKATKPDGFITKPYTDDSLRVALELALQKK